MALSKQQSLDVCWNLVILSKHELIIIIIIGIVIIIIIPIIISVIIIIRHDYLSWAWCNPQWGFVAIKLQKYHTLSGVLKELLHNSMLPKVVPRTAYF